MVYECLCVCVCLCIYVFHYDLMIYHHNIIIPYLLTHGTTFMSKFNIKLPCCQPGPNMALAGSKNGHLMIMCLRPR